MATGYEMYKNCFLPDVSTRFSTGTGDGSQLHVRLGMRIILFMFERGERKIERCTGCWMFFDVFKI